MRRPRRGKLQHMAATPLTFDFDGKQYHLVPLDLRRYAVLEQWAKEQPFREIPGKLAGIPDQRLREKVEARLIDEAVANSENPVKLVEYMNSSEALCKAFTLMLQTHQPDITDAEIDAIMSIKGLATIRAMVEELIEVPGNKGKNPQGGEASAAPPLTGPSSTETSPSTSD